MLDQKTLPALPHIDLDMCSEEEYICCPKTPIIMFL